MYTILKNCVLFKQYPKSFANIVYCYIERENFEFTNA